MTATPSPDGGLPDAGLPEAGLTEVGLTEVGLTESEFRALLAAYGLKLDGPALQAALQGARQLRAEIARLDLWLAELDAAP